MALPKAAIDSRGIRWKVHFDREWREWQVRAYKQSPTGAWKFWEGPTYYTEDREDAIRTFNHIIGETRSNPVRYTTHAQGHYGGPSFDTKAEAIKQIRAWVKQDARDCRRKFGTAIVENWQNKVWEVKPVRGSHGPMWSRYSIHTV